MATLTAPPDLDSRTEADSLPSDTQRVHDARRLLSGQPTAQIVLDGQVYVLRITKTGKLILTK